VPTTSAAFAVTAASAYGIAAAGTVKSIHTSAAPGAGTPAAITTPSGCPVATVPASCPSAGLPARSVAAVSLASGPAATIARTSARPMRPSAPRIAMRTAYTSLRSRSMPRSLSRCWSASG
jgi:hypothetical protein